MKKPMYESDTTRFLRELKAKNPQIVEQQKKNRMTWWDRPQDLDAWKERAQANVPQPGYVYFPLPRQLKDDDKDSGKRLSTPSRPA
ncbi:MAG TPA: DUF3460 family protein [Usitatibacter sp.]|nr:DUF3460 family protein [Usitatibacter sp.]